MKKALLFLLLLCTPVWASPTNTMNITPSAVDGTTITASDENTRNNEISTKFNAHSHTDITQVGNTLKLGDATAGNKTIQANTADATLPFVRWDDTNNKWTLSMDGVNTSNFVTVSGGGNTPWTAIPSQGEAGQSLILSGPNLVFGGARLSGDLEYHNGTTLTTLKIGSASQVLTVSGGLPAWTTLTADSDNVFVGSTTRDTTTASGTQAITGVGFQPTGVVFFVNQTNSREMSWGLDDGTNRHCVFDDQAAAGTYEVSGSASITLEETSGSASYSGVISSFDSGGFTITWTRTGTPSGTATVKFIAWR